MPTVEARQGITEIAPGLYADVKPILPPTGSTSETAVHESEHGLLGIEEGPGVNWMSIEPTDEYQGVTMLKGPSALAAVGPHVMGRRGTEFDIMSVIRRGLNPDSFAGKARSILGSTLGRFKVKVLAFALQRKGSMLGSQAAYLLDKAENLVASVEEGGGYFIPIELSPEKQVENDPKTWQEYKVDEADPLDRRHMVDNTRRV
jgi:hypothetical protein